jgi:hypothetical protein
MDRRAMQRILRLRVMVSPYSGVLPEATKAASGQLAGHIDPKNGIEFWRT